jgi:hypothetical protein
MRRPPSYSDSYLTRMINIQGTLTPSLEPLVIPADIYPPTLKLNEVVPEKKTIDHICVIFIIKGSLHLFFISIFETVFYFLYVSQSENQGILNTIDTYYSPIVQSCSGWSNISRILIGFVLHEEFNKTVIDNDGRSAEISRSTFNRGLLYQSIWYSTACLGICVAMVVIVWFRKIYVKWQKLMLEHLAFVLILGLYEYFYYETIIYKYETISTAELNRYIVDGLYKCVAR